MKNKHRINTNALQTHLPKKRSRRLLAALLATSLGTLSAVGPMTNAHAGKWWNDIVKKVENTAKDVLGDKVVNTAKDAVDSTGNLIDDVADTMLDVVNSDDPYSAFNNM